MRTPDSAIRLILAAASMVLLLAGCTSKPGVVFDPANLERRWPPAPDEPRIAYLGELRTDQDLKPGRKFGGALRDFFSGKAEPRAMVSPLGVCTDGADRVFVADPGVRGIHVFNLQTRGYELWCAPKKDPAMVSPVAVAFDTAHAGGRLLVADSAAPGVVAFDTTGLYVGTLTSVQLHRPVGIAVEPTTGRIFVADAGAHQIVVLTPDGREERRVGERGIGLGQFNFPTHLAFAADGCLYVSDTLNFRVQVFGTDLSPRRQIGSKGDLPGYFAQTKGIAFDSQGHLYVVDAHFEAVQLFDATGSLLMTFGSEGRGPGEFWLPAGVHADPKGRVWIADSYNRRVQAFQFLTQGGTP